MTLNTATQTCRPARISRLGGVFQALKLGLTRARAVRCQRRDLARLDDRMLRDIGLTRTEARREAQRAVWDAPETWRV